jgi:hypothetical protein
VNTWPDSLVREIAERRVVFFFGSGLSRSCVPELPSWGDLIRRLSSRLPTASERKFIDKLIKNGALLDAAQIIKDRVDPGDLASDFREIFQLRPVPTHEIYKDLLLMDAKTIVTTNYDELIERNFQYFSNDQVAYNMSRYNERTIFDDIKSPVRSILKVHGCISDTHNLILDRCSYFEARKSYSDIFYFLESLMNINTVLFVGYSFSDPDIQIILENIKFRNGNNSPHYALISKFPHNSIRESFRKTYNIKAVEYDINNTESFHSPIKKLREQVEHIRAQRGIV